VFPRSQVALGNAILTALRSVIMITHMNTKPYFYYLLDINRDASAAEIRAAAEKKLEQTKIAFKNRDFRSLGLPPSATQEMMKNSAQKIIMEIKEAYKVLSDPLKRKEYDDAWDEERRAEQIAALKQNAAVKNVKYKTDSESKDKNKKTNIFKPIDYAYFFTTTLIVSLMLAIFWESHTHLAMSIIENIILLASIVFVLFIVLIIYENRYYKSKDFNKIKKSLNKYVISCNELNEHIEELKKTYSEVKKTNYGNAQLNDASKFNYKRKEQLNAQSSSYIYECSASVCKNAETQPFKYLCKYFNIKPNEESLENFENVLNSFSAAEEGKQLLGYELEKIKKNIENDIPFIIKYFDMKTFMLKLGFKAIDFSTLYFPIYTFRYISPSGNKSTHCDIKLDLNNLNNFVEYLAEKIKFKKSAAGQRALMTSKLRWKIKERDNYTCQICGLSTNDEKNLLLEIDHIIPISKGGISTEENLQTLCWKCNRTKGAKVNV
jgi:hypothetical protein